MTPSAAGEGRARGHRVSIPRGSWPQRVDRLAAISTSTRSATSCRPSFWASAPRWPAPIRASWRSTPGRDPRRGDVSTRPDDRSSRYLAERTAHARDPTNATTRLQADRLDLTEAHRTGAAGAAARRPAHARRARGRLRRHGVRRGRRARGRNRLVQLRSAQHAARAPGARDVGHASISSSGSPRR